MMNNFVISYTPDGKIEHIIHRKDPLQMKWAVGTKLWGTVLCKPDLHVTTQRELTDAGTFRETYTFENTTGFDIFTLAEDIGIYVPFPDYYTDAEICMRSCCHTHIWCGDSGSYIMALRMSGLAPHLGLVLTEGGLKGYSIERHPDETKENVSNRRGDFIVHPVNFHLRPGEVYTLSWELFWFDTREEFREMLQSRSAAAFIEANRCIVFPKDQIRFQILLPEKSAASESTDVPAGLYVMRDGQRKDITVEEGKYFVEDIPERLGEYNYDIFLNNRRSTAGFLALPDINSLTEARCNFIVSHQQYHEEGSHLDGAFLIYDNEEKQMYYSHFHDHNGGRERVAMGLLLAVWLQIKPDMRMKQAFDKNLAYILRELFDKDTGTVFNDVCRNNDWHRLYNYPWMGCLWLELYNLEGDTLSLEWMFKCLEAFYRAGGGHFYALGIPVLESVTVLRKAGMIVQADSLQKMFEDHAEYMIQCGRNYPAHEVDYEQSIVAPAAIMMCEMYLLTKKEKYRVAALEQLEVLSLFQATQPDYHMNSVAIRHWDDYWFGKRRMLGDTYPHYWSVLSGYAFYLAGQIPGGEQYGLMAEATLRGVLSLIREDGSASCAMVYPLQVNGQAAHFYDEWANDQDWALYYYLKTHR